MLPQRAGVIRAVRIVGRLEIDGVGLVAGPGLVVQLAGQGQHLADGGRGEEPGQLGGPVTAELVLARLPGPGTPGWPGR